jgi:hypothetical protein
MRSLLFEIARVLVRLDHVARFIRKRESRRYVHGRMQRRLPHIMRRFEEHAAGGAPTQR